MTLSDAVRKLNERRHNDIDNWRIEDGFVVGDFREYRSVFEPFDAIAIAEKLERQAGRDMPATRHVMAMLADLRGDDCDDDDSLVEFARSEAVAEALNEWSYPNPSTETDV